VIWERAIAENAWQLDEGLYRILLPLPSAVPFVNAYVVESRGEFALVDCGTDWLPSLRALGRALKVIGVPSRGMGTLLLTHRHPDHANAARAVHERWGGRILIDSLERSDAARPPTDFRAWLVANGADAATAERASGPTRDRPSALPAFAEDLVTDQPLAIGDLRLEVIRAPGHSPGQVMLREPSRGWLLTADHVLPILAPNVWLFADDIGDPLGDYLDGLARAAGIAASLILPSHGLPWRGTVRDAALALRDFHLEFVSRIAELISTRRLNAWEIARAIRPKTPEDPVGVRFSLAEVLAGLRYLQLRERTAQAEDSRWGALPHLLG
jgi:glyoxylase-like metal-dependent hydrolase (beta-lactamase superfamily II)